jgi:hypothetical protein
VPAFFLSAVLQRCAERERDHVGVAPIPAALELLAAEPDDLAGRDVDGARLGLERRRPLLEVEDLLYLVAVIREGEVVARFQFVV